MVAHGTTVRSIVKVIMGLSVDAVQKFEVPTAIPYVITFDKQLNVRW